MGYWLLIYSTSDHYPYTYSRESYEYLELEIEECIELIRSLREEDETKIYTLREAREITVFEITPWHGESWLRVPDAPIK